MRRSHISKNAAKRNCKTNARILGMRTKRRRAPASGREATGGGQQVDAAADAEFGFHVFEETGRGAKKGG